MLECVRLATDVAGSVRGLPVGLVPGEVGADASGDDVVDAEPVIGCCVVVVDGLAADAAWQASPVLSDACECVGESPAAPCWYVHRFPHLHSSTMTARTSRRSVCMSARTSSSSRSLLRRSSSRMSHAARAPRAAGSTLMRSTSQRVSRGSRLPSRARGWSLSPHGWTTRATAVPLVGRRSVGAGRSRWGYSPWTWLGVRESPGTQLVRGFGVTRLSPLLHTHAYMRDTIASLDWFGTCFPQ